jgi:hypothetical protein
MAVDDLVEGVLRFIARPLVEGFVELFLRGICSFVGFWTLRVLSAGRYPPSNPTQKQLDFCGFIGLLVIVGVIATIIWLAVPQNG